MAEENDGPGLFNARFTAKDWHFGSKDSGLEADGGSDESSESDGGGSED